MELVERGASRARLVLQQKKIRRTSKNIILRIPGTEQPEKILTLTAHYDSVPQGPGAYDNMAGAAIIMELAHYFAENRPKRTLECIWSVSYTHLDVYKRQGRRSIISTVSVSI